MRHRCLGLDCVWALELQVCIERGLACSSRKVTCYLSVILALSLQRMLGRLMEDQEGVLGDGRFGNCHLRNG